MIFWVRGAPPLAFVHLLISMSVLAVATLLLLRTQAMGSAVQFSERRYRTVFDSLAVAIWEHDFSPIAAELRRLRARGVADIRKYVAEHPDFVVAMRGLVRITDVNATALSMMNVRAKEDFFSHLSGFLPETDDSFAECIIAIDERRALFQTEAIVVPMNGEPKQVIVAFGLGPDACLERVPGSILDVSHRRLLETQILRTREELAEVQRTSALAAMSASIAHELNQPMSAIHSFADAARRWLARDVPNLLETSRALAGLTQGVEHARGVMQRVRSLVGEARIDFAEVELDGLLATTVALMRREASESGTRLVVVPLSEETLTVMGDRILLKQVFVNLITNAIQAMLNEPPNSRIVTLTLERREDTAVVTVADQGPGWDGLDAGQAFGTFFTTKKNGMGLGLAISRTTIERHEGMIFARNAEPAGAVVEVVLPLSLPFDAAALDCGLHGGQEEVSV
ncbi:ATP-binding protein [Sphingomonas sp. BIUV-7]|uniref:histidine kinase n=1 Tax=Sphingomonas natans TaxID=3063330 RepID=A0ABT8Y961_9SPHN|nr:ATP-binding protein [Sphingomonas sp. BIUV-7]MDO6414210.1 ATP-binding protein [Sphingomonas sp. BIUV-7]